MANANYNRGRRWEWQVKKEYEDEGWLVFRMAGSKGAFDLIAISNGSIYLIQCKTLKNGTVKQAMNLLKKWRKNPPLPRSDYFSQILEVNAMKDRYQASEVI